MKQATVDHYSMRFVSYCLQFGKKLSSFWHGVCVTRSELVNWISGQSRYLDQSLVDGALHDLLQYMADCLKKGHRIEIRGFGTFALRYRRPRMARNPKTGAILYTEEKYIPHFKPGKALREQVNEAYLLQVKRKQGWASKNKEKYQDSDASG